MAHLEFVSPPTFPGALFPPITMQGRCDRPEDHVGSAKTASTWIGWKNHVTSNIKNYGRPARLHMLRDLSEG